MATTTTTTGKPLSAEQVFDSIGPAYEDAFADLKPQLASIDWLLSQLQTHKPAKILDIGCGTGRPVCSRLADAGHDVLGIDVSGTMIEDAKKKVPNARFWKLDVTEYHPEKESFDAVTVYFSMIASVTQDQIRQNIKSIFTWLGSGGYFVFATVPLAGNNSEINWLGRDVVVSSLGAEEAVNCIRKAGFDVLFREETEFKPRAKEAGICGGERVWTEPHLFVYARKP
ncbi:hypothetical protein LTR78_005234 [Recurvomyces mirabilis]|uniref:Methyltransferase domain-containing protein n=1 Tax=Recurvomyces mirabilis TaxID=574656 RepID=A0AAE0WNI6_9PEZI|nr:hypothetical protein LTR78_005234 [Recurvomyces mirabilis]KAK5157784.1 hypothetical protein LTS14_003706 [Recurvomyces mirabilis]